MGGGRPLGARGDAVVISGVVSDVWRHSTVVKYMELVKPRANSREWFLHFGANIGSNAVLAGDATLEAAIRVMLPNILIDEARAYHACCHRPRRDLALLRGKHDAPLV
eukprot:7383949-Prymnesium_polylepis.3